MLPRSLGLSREARDFELSPSRSAKDAAGVIDRHIRQTRQALTSTRHQVFSDLQYGQSRTQRLDLFVPATKPCTARPCVLFLHGGFWQEGTKDGSGFAAQMFTQLGWAYAAIGYSLTPGATLSDIVGEIHQAVSFVHDRAASYQIDRGSIILVGHSAGAHLAACIVANVLNKAPNYHIAGAVLISGVFDLEPIVRSYVNEKAGISAREVEALSPARHLPAFACAVDLLIGADEPMIFHEQSEALAVKWGAYLDRFSVRLEQNKDHFDILDSLADAQGETVQRMQEMVLKNDSNDNL